MNIWYFMAGVAVGAALFRVMERMNEYGKRNHRMPEVEEGRCVRDKVQEIWASFPIS